MAYQRTELLCNRRISQNIDQLIVRAAATKAQRIIKRGHGIIFGVARINQVQLRALHFCFRQFVILLPRADLPGRLLPIATRLLMPVLRSRPIKRG